MGAFRREARDAATQVRHALTEAGACRYESWPPRGRADLLQRCRFPSGGSMAEGSAGVCVPAGTADYERMRQRHVRRFEALFAGYCDRIDWSAEQLRRERVRLLRALLSEAVKKSLWHRERLAHVDVREILESDLEA